MLRSLRIENLVLIRHAELELAPGLNAITGETGAGKTILAQAVGLLLGARGDSGMLAPGAPEAYVEAELDLPEELLGEEGLEGVAELRPEGEDGVVLARRVFPDGRTRAYLWGRSAAREDVALLGERLIAMSGQFEQRRLARPSYQLDVLDRFAGDEQRRRRSEARRAWRELAEALRRLDELTGGAAEAEARLAELRALVEDAEGLSEESEAALLSERELLRRAEELVAGTGAAVEALAPDEGDGAAALAGRAEHAVAPLDRLAPALARAGEELRDLELRLRETASELRGFLASLEGSPGRLDEVEAELERYADARRRFRVSSTAELLRRVEAAQAELEEWAGGSNPAEAAAEAAELAERRFEAIAGQLRAARLEAAGPFGESVTAELRDVGMGEGEFRAELAERAPSASGGDEVRFAIRPNRGLPFGSVADTASGGELSRVALAIAAVAGGETLVFDEIDAGIGGRTANAVGQALQRLGERAQVLTITHLPQIASLAERHFRVEKVDGDPTRTTIELLGEDERRDEIERMLGGREFLSLLSSGQKR